MKDLVIEEEKKTSGEVLIAFMVLGHELWSSGQIASQCLHETRNQ